MRENKNNNALQEYNQIFSNRKNKSIRIANGSFLPVVNIYDFLYVYTNKNKYSYNLYSNFINFYNNVESDKEKVDALKDYIFDVDEKNYHEIMTTEIGSSCLTDDISFIPFKYKNEDYIAVWVLDFQGKEKSDIVFLKLKIPIKKFIDATKKIYYKDKKGKKVFIDYSSDMIDKNIVFKNTGFYLKNKKAQFVL
jgi:hypothetical protein